MRREYFGLLGSLFSDQQLARVIVLGSEESGALGQFLRGRLRFEAMQQAFVRKGESLGQSQGRKNIPLKVTLSSVRQLFIGKATSEQRVTQLRDHLDALWDALTSRQPPHYALRVTRTGESIDRQWLSELLKSEPRIDSVFFESASRAGGAWNWPLRVGLPDTTAGKELHSRLLGARYKYLFNPVMVGGEADSVDLLLIPGPLGTSMTLHPRGSLAAEAVLVLGGAEMPPPKANALLKALKDRYGAGLSGVCFVPRAERQPWLQTVIRELSHNHELPTAVFLAKDAVGRQDEGGDADDLAAPLLLGDPAFVEDSTIAASAIRFGNALIDGLHSAPSGTLDASTLPNVGVNSRNVQNAEELGRAIVQEVKNFSWLSERGDAQNLVVLREAVEEQIGPVSRARRLSPVVEPVEHASDAPRASTGHRPRDFGPVAAVKPLPPLPPAAESRFVQASVRAVGGPDEAAVALKPSTDYRLQVHIGHSRTDTAVADQALDESTLPPSHTGHDLDLVYCPLSPIPVGEGGQTVPPPSRASVHLPRVGDSTAAEFLLRTGEDARSFRARLIVAHKNRVLQTLSMRSGPNHELQIRQENRYTRSYQAPYAAAPVDLAFVVNDNPQGASGVATLAGINASFVEPPGLKNTIEAIESLLSKSNIQAAGDVAPDLGDTDMVGLMINLAMHGAVIVKQLRRQHAVAVFESAQRVQVLEAIDKVYLPVEFFYSGMAPAPTAQLCPNAAAALASTGNTVHSTCAHRNSDQYVCPAAFWGFSKCIERRASDSVGAHTFSEPELGADRVGPIDCALLAASKQAAAEMTGSAGVPMAVEKFVPNVALAQSWTEWREKVAALLPKLLLLLPHSDISPNAATHPALEISGTWLETARIEPLDVAPGGNASPGPLVLLLGCSTQLASIDYLNAVQRFSQEGAPIVLGTLATVHVTQAAQVACRLIDLIKTAGASGARFDEVLLRLKRELLSEGHGVALGLVAYGHSSWRI